MFQLPPVPSPPKPLDGQVLEDRLRTMMSSPLVDQVLAMGLEISRIQSALEKKLKQSGCGYKNAHDLAEAAFKEPSSSTQQSSKSTSSLPAAAASHSGASAAAASVPEATATPSPTAARPEVRN